MKLLSLVLILGSASGAIAADAVAPAAPDPATPAPPVVPQSEAAPATPAAAQVGSVARDTSAASGGNRAAVAAGGGTAEKSREFGLFGQVAYGYDSNILREDTLNPDPSGKEGQAYSFEGRGLWRVLRNEDARLNLIADVKFNGYEPHADARTLRFGGAAVGQLHTEYVDPGLLVSYNRLLFDDRGAATLSRGALSLTHIDESRRHADTLFLDVQLLRYDNFHDQSGDLYDTTFRHWHLFEPNNSHKRIEVTFTGGYFDAQIRPESYWSISPGIAFAYRFGAQRADEGTYDLNLGIQWETRAYSGAASGQSQERQDIWATSAAVDRWFCRYLSGGVYGLLSERFSNIVGRDYDRIQVGARLTATW